MVRHIPNFHFVSLKHKTYFFYLCSIFVAGGGTDNTYHDKTETERKYSETHLTTHKTQNPTSKKDNNPSAAIKHSSSALTNSIMLLLMVIMLRY